MRPLGKNQQDVLESMKEFNGWHRGCGWYWDTHSNTERILDSLVKRGLVEVSYSSRGTKLYKLVSGS